MTRAEPGKQARRDWLRPVPEHVPPHNLEAEEAVLGAILASGAAAGRGRRPPRGG